MLESGELVQHHLENVKLHNDERKPVGQLWVTNFRVLFRENDSSAQSHALTIPISQIGGIAKGRSNKTSLRLYCKNLITLHVSFKTAQDAKLVHRALSMMQGNGTIRSRKGTVLGKCFALAHRQEFAEHIDGWRVYDTEREFIRQGVLSKDEDSKSAWRLSTINRNYKLAPDYPGKVIVPRDMDEADLLEAATLHVNSCLPVMVWQNESGAALCRCLRKNHPEKSAYEDDKLVASIVAANPFQQPLRVFKTFPTTITKRSATSGKLTARSKSSSQQESLTSLPGSASVAAAVSSRLTNARGQLAHTLNLQVDGVKRVDEIRNRLREACARCADGSPPLHDDDACVVVWLQSIRRALRAADSLVDTIDTRTSILVESDEHTEHVHVLSLFLLLVDPYYRTLNGFEVLIEKEWLSFGHRFLQPKKVSHSSNKNLLLGDEISPIFLQFMDAVWQLQQWFPRAFEFNQKVLSFVLDAVYSEQFGTFLFESERERVENLLHSTTTSVWSAINFKRAKFLNPFYRARRRLKLPANPVCQLWSELYLAWSQRSLIERAGEVLRASSDSRSRLLSLQKVGIAFLPYVGPVKARYAWEDVKLAKNFLTVIPLQIMQCHRLTRLDLSENRFSAISPHVLRLFGRRCPRLANVNFRGNQLEELPEGIQYLTSLRVLDVARNKLRQVSNALGRMKRLRELSLSGNQLEELPEEVQQIKTLRILDLSNNPMRTLPVGVLQLRRLTSLNLSSLGISQLPEELRQLLSLSTLILDNNMLQEIPMSLCILGSLRKLSLQNNRITSLPLEIANLVNLRELNVADNLLESLSSGLGNLVNIRSLSVRNNRLKHLPSNFGFLQKLARLKLEDNPWKTPPREVVNGGLESVMQFMKDLLAGAAPCFRMKLMIVGQENVGKTSLLRCLTRKKNAKGKLDLHTISTDGIDIEKWQFTTNISGTKQEVTLSAWDFAGQELYYTTHQFFLSARSLYLVVFNLVEGDVASRVPFWLQSIKSRAGPQVPIVLVGTHLDEFLTNGGNGVAGMSTGSSNGLLGGNVGGNGNNGPVSRERIIMDLQDKYARKFSNIESIHLVSCLTQKGMDGLRGEIERLVGLQPHMGEEFPTSYLELEKMAMAEKKRMPPIVTAQDFAAMAIMCNIRDQGELASATALLHNLGSLVHFDTEGLRDLIILDPQWLTDMMSTIVTTKHSFVRDGILDHTALRQIWREPLFPRSLHRTLLKLLQKFQIIYVLPGVVEDPDDDPWVSGSSFVPCLLPEARPHARVTAEFPLEAPHGETTLGRNYSFDFVPTGLFSRLLVKLLHIAPQPLVLWRNGIVFRRGAELLLIELQPVRRTLIIRLRGGETDNFRIVLETLESLTADFYEIEPEVYVPCVHCMEDNPLEPFMFPLSVCENAAIAGRPFVLCNGQRPIRVDTLVPDIAMSEVQSALLDFADLRRDRRIGKGGYSVVYQGRYLDEVVAIKRIKLPPGQAETEDSRREAFRQFRREVWLMSGLDHPNIVALKGFCITPICLVTEFLPYGNLYDYLHDAKRKLTWPLRLRVAMDVAKGCAFLHATKPAIIHRDLKSPNILLASVNPQAPVVAKVTDFGVSQILAPTTVGRAVACPVWLAPEVIKNEEYTEKADVYSFGVMLWELLTRSEFFGEIEFLSELQEAILEGKRPAIPDDCPPSYAKLVCACWAGEAAARPAFPDIIDLLVVIMEKQNVRASCDMWGADIAGDSHDELSTVEAHTETRTDGERSDRDSEDQDDDDEDEEEEDEVEMESSTSDDHQRIGGGGGGGGHVSQTDSDDARESKSADIRTLHLRKQSQKQKFDQLAHSKSQEVSNISEVIAEDIGDTTGTTTSSDPNNSSLVGGGVKDKKKKTKRKGSKIHKKHVGAQKNNNDEDDVDDDMDPIVGGEACALNFGSSEETDSPDSAKSSPQSTTGSPAGPRHVHRVRGSVIGGRPKHPAVELLRGKSPSHARLRRSSWVYEGDRDGMDDSTLSLPQYSLLAGDEDEFHDMPTITNKSENDPSSSVDLPPAAAAAAAAAANTTTTAAAVTPASGNAGVQGMTGNDNEKGLSLASSSVVGTANKDGKSGKAEAEVVEGGEGKSGEGTDLNSEEVAEKLVAALTAPSQKTKDHKSGFIRHLKPPLDSSVNVLLQVCTGCVWVGCSDGTITVLDVDEDERLGTHHAHFDRIFSMVNVDEHTVWSSSKDGTIRVWSSRYPFPKLKHKIRLKGMLAMCLLPVDRNTVWAGTSNGRLLIFDARNGKLRKQIKLDVPVVQCMTVGGDLVWVGADRMILRVHPVTYKVHGFVQGHKRVVHDMVACGDAIWSCSSDKSLRVWDINTAECLSVLECHSGRVFALFAESDRYVWSAGWDTSLIVWNAQTRVFAIEHRESHTDAVAAMCLVRGRTSSNRMPTLYAGSWDKLVSVWRLHTPPDVWARLEWVGAAESGQSIIRHITPKQDRPSSSRGSSSSPHKGSGSPRLGRKSIPKSSSNLSKQKL